MSVVDLIFGRPLRSSEESTERLSVAAGIPVFGLDALSSAAYGPEAALALLLGLQASGIRYIVPITISICALLIVVYLSYRQTIAAYPRGGGSYTVAGQNLGAFAGLLAAAALMIDYVLTAAVGISAGVGALVSAVPSLEPRTLALCLIILLFMTVVNLRGARETGVAFMIPTYLFVGTLSLTLGAGIVKSLLAGGHPVPVSPPPVLGPATAAVSVWLLLKAFSSGCTAMTGVEAVSNGVTAFSEPVVKTAQRTLTTVIGLLLILLLGIAYLARAYNVGATPSGPGYQSVLSQLAGAVFGKGPFYYVTIASILLVLAFSANTAFADFPRLCRLIAEDGYLPNPLAVRGRRLVFTVGITVLALLCAILLVLFGGVTDRLIPLFAVGAFLAFTMSQAGMVAHWLRTRGPGWRTAMMLNGLGALATAATAAIITVTKFVSGAWITTLLIPSIIAFMYSVRRHYDRCDRELRDPAPLDFADEVQPIVVMPVIGWNKLTREGLRLAFELSSEIHVLHIVEERTDDETNRNPEQSFREQWHKQVEEPALEAGLAEPQFVILKSPYRYVINPIVNYVLELQKSEPNRRITVIVPEFIEKHWYLYFLHNQRSQWLKAALLLRGNEKITVMNVPWYLEDIKH